MLPVFLAMFAYAENPVVVAKHATKPESASEHLTVDCEGMRLEIVRYRPRADALPFPEVKINGQKIPVPWRLRDDLLTPGAVYKFGALCSPDRTGFQVDIWEASRRLGEGEKYRWGRLTVTPSGRFDWRGFRAVSSDDFWFS